MKDITQGATAIGKTGLPEIRIAVETFRDVAPRCLAGMCFRTIAPIAQVGT